MTSYAPAALVLTVNCHFRIKGVSYQSIYFVAISQAVSTCQLAQREKKSMRKNAVFTAMAQISMRVREQKIGDMCLHCGELASCSLAIGYKMSLPWRAAAKTNPLLLVASMRLLEKMTNMLTFLGIITVTRLALLLLWHLFEIQFCSQALKPRFRSRDPQICCNRNSETYNVLLFSQKAKRRPPGRQSQHGQFGPAGMRGMLAIHDRAPLTEGSAAAAQQDGDAPRKLSSA